MCRQWLGSTHRTKQLFWICRLEAARAAAAKGKVGAARAAAAAAAAAHAATLGHAALEAILAESVVNLALLWVREHLRPRQQ